MMNVARSRDLCAVDLTNGDIAENHALTLRNESV
jgi:hypothetical protein